MCVLLTIFKVSTTNRLSPGNFNRMCLTSALCEVSDSSVPAASSLRYWNPFEGLSYKIAGNGREFEVTLKSQWNPNDRKNTRLVGDNYRILSLISSHEAVFRMLHDEQLIYSDMNPEQQDALESQLRARFPLLRKRTCPCCDLRLPQKHGDHLRVLAALYAIGGEHFRNLRYMLDPTDTLRLQYLTKDVPHTWKSFKDTRDILRIGRCHKYSADMIARQRQKTTRAQARRRRN